MHLISLKNNHKNHLKVIFQVIFVFDSVLKDKKTAFDAAVKADRFKSKISFIILQRQGAQPSLPYMSEVNKL